MDQGPRTPYPSRPHPRTHPGLASSPGLAGLSVQLFWKEYIFLLFYLDSCRGREDEERGR